MASLADAVAERLREADCPGQPCRWRVLLTGEPRSGKTCLALLLAHLEDVFLAAAEDEESILRLHAVALQQPMMIRASSADQRELNCIHVHYRGTEIHVHDSRFFGKKTFRDSMFMGVRFNSERHDPDYLNCLVLVINGADPVVSPDTDVALKQVLQLEETKGARLLLDRLVVVFTFTAGKTRLVFPLEYFDKILGRRPDRVVMLENPLGRLEGIRGDIREYLADDEEQEIKRAMKRAATSALELLGHICIHPRGMPGMKYLLDNYKVPMLLLPRYGFEAWATGLLGAKTAWEFLESVQTSQSQAMPGLVFLLEFYNLDGDESADLSAQIEELARSYGARHALGLVEMFDELKRDLDLASGRFTPLQQKQLEKMLALQGGDRWVSENKDRLKTDQSGQGSLLLQFIKTCDMQDSFDKLKCIEFARAISSQPVRGSREHYSHDFQPKKLLPRFAESGYNRRYCRGKDLIACNDVSSTWEAIERFLVGFLRKAGRTIDEAMRFKADLEDDVQSAMAHMTDSERRSMQGPQGPRFVLVMCWSSAQECPGLGREFCSLLNEATRNDDEDLLDSVTTIWASINHLVVANRQKKSTVVWPSPVAPRPQGGERKWKIRDRCLLWDEESKEDQDVQIIQVHVDRGTVNVIVQNGLKTRISDVPFARLKPPLREESFEKKYETARGSVAGAAAPVAAAVPVALPSVEDGVVGAASPAQGSAPAAAAPAAVQAPPPPPTWKEGSTCISKAASGWWWTAKVAGVNGDGTYELVVEDAHKTRWSQVPLGNISAMGLLYRGGRIPEEIVSWWRSQCQKQDPRFRVPMGVATSKLEGVAAEFMNRHGYPTNIAKVWYQYRLCDNPVFKDSPCLHVGCLESVSRVPEEQEFLFPPWSTFSARSITWSHEHECYIIDIDVMYDNQEQPLDLPVLEWA